VAVAPDGTVYVTDWGNDRVQFFAADGTYLGQWGSEGGGSGQFNAPAGVTVAPDGRTVYVADTYNDRIQVFAATSPLVSSWGRFGDGEGQFVQPSGVDVAPNGTVYVVDQGNHRIQAFWMTSSSMEERPRATPVAETPHVPAPVVTESGA
jgi:DNA-binding beta-propeller fold protein YncE